MANTTTTTAATTTAATTAQAAPAAPSTPAKAPAKGKGKAAPQGAPKAPAKGKGKGKATATHNPATGATAPGYGLRAAPTQVGKRRTNFAETGKVKLLVTANPKRPGTGAYGRFAAYQALANKHGNGKFTVAQVLNAGVQPSDIRYNVKHGYIAIT